LPEIVAGRIHGVSAVRWLRRRVQGEPASSRSAVLQFAGVPTDPRAALAAAEAQGWRRLPAEPGEGAARLGQGSCRLLARVSRRTPRFRRAEPRGATATGWASTLRASCKDRRDIGW